MKAKLVVILISLALLIIPSALAAGALALFFSYFFAWFLGALAVTFVIGQISNLWVQRKAELDILRVRNQLIEITSQQSVEVSCSYCKVRNHVPVKLNGRNTFECTACKQTNLIIFQFATAQVTTPLENPQLGTVPLPVKDSDEHNNAKTENN